MEYMNFAGTWARDPRRNENVIWGLIERGVPPEEAKSKAEGPYRQTWKRKTATIWNVKTYIGNTDKIRRELDYSIGTWKEPFWGTSLVFGYVDEDLERETSVFPEPDSDSQLALVTITDLPDRGKEEARRYMKEGKLILRRTFWPIDEANGIGIVSKEVFLREPDRN